MQQRTVRQLFPAIGTTVSVQFESIQVQCVVTDAKNAYGKVRLFVTPVAGTGEQWIELERLREPATALDRP